MDLSRLLDFMGQNQQVKTIIFTYLYQINDWFGAENSLTDHMSSEALSLNENMDPNVEIGQMST